MLDTEKESISAFSSEINWNDAKIILSDFILFFVVLELSFYKEIIQKS